MIRNRSILIDACVINSLLSKEKELARSTAKLLEDLTKEKNELYITDWTYYELMRGATERKSKHVESQLGNFPKIPLSEERVQRATKLYTAYSNDKNAKAILSSISDIDILNGALICTKQKPILLTGDFNDFPRPFFREIEIVPIEYERGRGNKCCQYYYFLEANLDLVKDDGHESK